ncbi:Glyoxalase/Bleomycin resistance protein/Dioxygenase superfamily protein [Pustulibacterium marinum]|uniref:Glyoxalase/Bleomycin resistance protein/Dioxygenase superfamily protein n=1 Tax=Pustulibacterium marinum TaxID=1224947 RepID=A0A1I7HH75_9FLAO|nr:VOC family protein [Pustulibacterium marinum]SFU59826.1 Glyoxalase/Bleomycin resistance protein/Dioxygenase superfamily protein [Pustulibacterium marinum]
MSKLTVKTIDHVLISIPIGSRAEAVNFYTKILGFDYIAKDHTPTAEWFQLGDKQLHIREEENINNSESNRHLALVVENLEAAKTYLESQKIDISRSTKIEGRERIFFRDLWGNRFELVEIT